MRGTTILALSAAMTAALTFTPTPAHAAVAWTIQDTTKQDRPTTIDLVGSFWFFGNTTFLGGAGWFGFPIVPEGFLPTLNDTFNLEVGAWAFVYSVQEARGVDYSYFALIPAGGVRWDFNLTRQWTVFATAKLGVRIGTGDAPHPFGPDFGASIGAYWNFSRTMFMRLESGNQGIVQAGVSIVL